MSLQHILLGLLARPSSGYQIKQEFNQSLRHFWFADLAQIYPTLHRMEKQGLVVSETRPSDKGPPQRIYTRTEDGRAELREWLLNGPETGRERFAYLAQVFFLADELGTPEVESFFEKLTAYFEQRVATLEAIEQHWVEAENCQPGEFPDEEFYPWLTLSLGKVRNLATLDWCRQTLDDIRARSPGKK
ncbi:MAG: PadR family transcriptional regulator [Xanthomonadales bacterium]|nr:PadR family transcriptional regulator [Xanthomonadales bacterium]